MWMPSLDLATGLWARMRRTLYTLFSRLSRAAQRFWMSRAYFPVLLTVSAAFMAAGEPVYGVAALGCIVIWLLAACPDLLAPVCPFFMAFLMSSQCYGQLTDFLPCAALVPPLLVALLWHFAVWPVTLRIGRSGLGLALVSIATLLGGCDVISRKQAMEPLSLYYTLGLGVGMLVLYVLFRSHLTEKRSYDLHRRFAEIFCALGLCMALAVLLAYGKAWLAEGHIGGVLYLSYRNFATSVLLRRLRGGPAASAQELRTYHDRLLEAYRQRLSGDQPVMHRMWELWAYLSAGFTQPEPYLKRMRKAKNLPEYRAAVDALFREQRYTT